jgi:hypothetical protein
MFSDERANELLNGILDVVCPTFRDAMTGFQSTGCWPDGYVQNPVPLSCAYSPMHQLFPLLRLEFTTRCDLSLDLACPSPT